MTTNAQLHHAHRRFSVRGRRVLAQFVAVVMLCAAATGCSGPTAGNSTTTAPNFVLDPPDPARAIPGLKASKLLADARVAMPDATEQTVTEGWLGVNSVTKTFFGYPDPLDPDHPGEVRVSAPGIWVYWQTDDTVAYVTCDDLVTAGLSPVMKFCTGLHNGEFPTGSLEAFFNSAIAGGETPQIKPSTTADTWTYQSITPTNGRARTFAILRTHPFDGTSSGAIPTTAIPTTATPTARS